MSPDDSSHDAQDGWTHVKSRFGRGGKNKSKTQAPAKGSGPKTEGLRSVVEIEDEYYKVRSQWESSACCKALRQLMATKLSSQNPISEAICLGMGTFDPADDAWHAKRTTYIQLIAFLIMVEELEILTKKAIPCVFQEPLFTKSDKAFLSKLGHRVVEDPKACGMVSDNTLLFGVHLYRPLYAQALDSNLPAIFVGTGWDIWDRLLSNTDELRQMEMMERTYGKCQFPEDVTSPGSSAFSDTSIYWRYCDDSDGPDEPAGRGAVVEQPNLDEEQEQELVDSMKSTTI